MLIVPSIRKPRLLVPGSAPRAAANAVLAHGHATSAQDRLQRRVLALTLRAGLGPFAFRGWRHVVELRESLFLDHLSAVLGRPVVAAIALTPPRANRKPVLHLLDVDGRTVAFVKIGINPLTSALVRHEAATLAMLHTRQLTALRVPEVLHTGEWNSLEVLVLSPLPTAQAATPEPVLLRAAMQQIAAISSDLPPHPPGGYAAVLRVRAQALPTSGETRDHAARSALADIAGELAGGTVGAELRLGSWHGDWTPWNCGQTGAEVVVWDWERAHGPVPVGFDALHYQLQQSLVGPHASTPEAATRCILDAPKTLADWDVRPEQAELTAALYLIEIGLRYLADDQRAAGGRGGDVESWIVPAVADYLARQPSRGINT